MRRQVGSVHAVSRAASNHADDNFKAPTATTPEQNNGAFPGEQALFDSNLLRGTLVAAAELNSNAKDFTLVVMDGTRKYRAVTGNSGATPAGRLAQHLVISPS